MSHEWILIHIDSLNRRVGGVQGRRFAAEVPVFVSDDSLPRTSGVPACPSFISEYPSELDR